jgi:hypothetical protein
VKTNKLVSLVLSFVLLLAVSVSSVAAQNGGPAQPDGELSVDATVNSRIGYQGVLKEGGVPVTGTRNMTFRLYSNSTCTTQVGSDIVKNGVPVANGLFNVALDVNQNNFDGQGIWVRLVVGGTSLSCQEMLPAPYALSLRPGATIVGDSPHGLAPVLGVIDNGTGAAITAMSSSADGIAGLFWQNNSNGYAIYASGKIASSRKTYLWMSGNGLEKWLNADTLYFNHNDHGGSTIYPGTSVATQYVVMPVTIAGTLYGQDVKLTSMDVYWQCSGSDLMGITNIRLRRSIDANSYEDIGVDNTDYVCYVGDNPDGCTIHLDLTTLGHNVLSADSGILHLVIGLNFAGETSWNRIDGIRLTLEYQE